MFTFKVVGLSEASVEIDRNWPTRIVTLISECIPVEHRGDHHLIIHVEDVHREEEGDGPTMGMLETIFRFVNDLEPDDRLLVHCFAGQSRSTATMLGILMERGVPWEEAFEAVRANRDLMLPNQLIIKLLDQRHGLNGALIAYNNTYVANKLREKIYPTDSSEGTELTNSQVSAMADIMKLFR
jgi:predicted protein tyrosine phosphatase